MYVLKLGTPWIELGPRWIDLVDAQTERRSCRDRHNLNTPTDVLPFEFRGCIQAETGPKTDVLLPELFGYGKHWGGWSGMKRV